MSRFIPLMLLPALALAAAGSPDQGFYTKAAEGGMAEVELGQLAQQKAQSASVKEFGAKMVKDHSAANDRLKGLASKNGVKLPASPNAAHMASKTKMSALSGQAFDKSYVKAMLDDHKKDVAEFEQESKSGKDADARSFATQTLPTLREHLMHVRQLAADMGVQE